MRTIAVALIAVVVPLFASWGVAPTAEARGPVGIRPVGHFRGQVTDVTVESGMPVRFSLQTRRRIVLFRIAPYATFTALSAEAEVEGLSTQDYAVVLARHVGHLWVAVHIAFDVQPIQTVQTAVSATVIRVTPTNNAVVVRLQAGTLRRLAIVPTTRFRVAGQLTGELPTLLRGDIVRVAMRLAPRGWIAVEIDLQHVALMPD